MMIVAATKSAEKSRMMLFPFLGHASGDIALTLMEMDGWMTGFTITNFGVGIGMEGMQGRGKEGKDTVGGDKDCEREEGNRLITRFF